MTERAPQHQDKFIVRLPDGLRDRIKAAAMANNRSMNAEVVAALRERFPEPTDQDFEKIFEIAEQLSPGAFARLTQELLDRDLASGKITERDLEDGLIPGFTVIRVADIERIPAAPKKPRSSHRP